MTTAHVAPLAAWMAEHHPDVQFNRERWAGTLSWSAEQIAAALAEWDTSTVPTSASLNGAIRRTENYRLARSKIDELRSELHRSKPDLAAKRAERERRAALDATIDERRRTTGRAS